MTARGHLQCFLSLREREVKKKQLAAGWREVITRRCARLSASFALLVIAGAGAHTLDEVRFEQRLDAAVPLRVPVRDAQGRAGTFGDFFHGRPVLLALVYYHCPNFCGTMLSALTDAVVRSGLGAGRDFELAVLSIDPRETPAQAAKERRTLAHQAAGRAGIGGAQFLTAPPDTVAALTRAVGFHYYYDAALDQYAHPAGAVVLTPSGRVARYLYGAPFDPAELRRALIQAADFRIGNPLERVWLRCFHYDPATGRYSIAILEALRVFSGLVLGVMVAGFWFARRRALRHD